MFERVKIGLALGAGGARGLAHLGVLKALEKAGVEISFIAGSSIGALVGAGYALSGNITEVEQQALGFITSDFYKNSGLPMLVDVFLDRAQKWHERVETWLKKTYVQARFVSTPAVLDSDTYRGIIEYFLPKINIENLTMPFCALGTDLRSGKPVIFKTGPLRAAVYASAAIPGLVLPLATEKMLVVDGGVLNMVPVQAVRHMGADVVLAVDVEKHVAIDDTEVGNAIDQLFRVEDIQGYCLKEMILQGADLVLRPDVGHIHWSEFNRANEMIRLGQDEVARRLDEIKALASKRKHPWRHSKSQKFVENGCRWVEI